MDSNFDFFVVLAEMRTGSNFLEENLNAFPGVRSYGEVFNPHFIGHAGKKSLFGHTIADRESDPLALVRSLRENTEGLAGFRFFHDHDPRILTHCLEDARCAKIVLTRNPLDSYISHKIVQQTGQWRLNDARHAKSAKVTFVKDEFEKHLAAHQAFQNVILHALQTSGQTAFFIGYEDIPDVEVLNGLAVFLGTDSKLRKTSRKTKKQNPEPLESKVVNFQEMEAALASIDHFGLNRTPSFEPQRGPVIPNYVAAPEAGLLYMPVGSGPGDSILDWMARVEGCPPEQLVRGLNQKSLRQWKRKARGHRTFTVVRHPVERLHACFVSKFLTPGAQQFSTIRRILRETYGVPFPEDPAEGFADLAAHKAAFLSFAAFIKSNLAAQTSIRIDSAWATQAETISGMAQFAFPDHVLREPELQVGLEFLAGLVGHPAQPYHPTTEQGSAAALADIYDDDIEAAVRAAYQRDYMMFGFGPWGEAPQAA